MPGKHWNRLEVIIQFMALKVLHLFTFCSGKVKAHQDRPLGSLPPLIPLIFVPNSRGSDGFRSVNLPELTVTFPCTFFPPLNRKIHFPPHFHSLNSKLIPNIPPGKRQV